MSEKLHAAVQERVKSENPHGQFLFKGKKPEEIINHIHSHDPTGSSYKPWLTKTYLNKGIRYAEDLPRAKNALELFHKHKSKLPNPDINSYKTLPELETAVKPYEKRADEGKSWSEKGRELINNGEAKEHHNDKDYHIVQPLTEAASKHFGVNTKWCTAATNSRNYFNDYKGHGKLSYVLHKPKNKRYAVFEPNDIKKDPEAFNEDDTELDSRKFGIDHPKAAEELQKHLHPLNYYIVGKTTDLTPEHWKQNRIKAIRSTNDEKKVDEAMKDKDPYVRAEVARQGNLEHLNHLMHDEHPWVRETVANRGKPEHLNHLMHDEHPWVRETVANRGKPEHLNHLMHDEDPRVRMAVAEQGNPDHLNRLINDKEATVRRAVARHGNLEHLNHLMKDKDRGVRAAVAEQGNPEHLNRLMKDKDWVVRRAVAQRGNPVHLNYLMNDESPWVRDAARERLKELQSNK